MLQTSAPTTHIILSQNVSPRKLHCANRLEVVRRQQAIIWTRTWNEALLHIFIHATVKTASTFTHNLDRDPPMPSNASAVRVVNSLASKFLHRHRTRQERANGRQGTEQVHGDASMGYCKTT